MAYDRAAMNRTLRSTQYLAFVGLGYAQGIVGPILPEIQKQIPMSDWRAGLFGSGQFLGILLAGLVGGPLADRLGKKRFVLLSSGLLAVGLLGYALSGAYGLLLASAVVTGLGGGGYEVGVNALQADHADEEEAGHGMSLLHAFYGVGAVAAPFLVQFALREGLGWKPAMFAAAALPVAVLAVLAPQHVSRGRGTPEAEAGDLFLSVALWVCGLVFLLYVGIEMSIGVWIPTFWARRAAGAFVEPAIMSAVFWGTLTAGRFVVGKLADRIGHLRFLALAAVLVLLIGGLWALWPSPAVTLAAVIALGLVLAGVYPTAMVLATDAFPGHSGKVVGFLSVFVAVGGLLPSVVGRLSDASAAHDLGVLPPAVVGLGVLLFAAVAAIRLPRRAAAVTPASR
jgi:fucose permease